MPYLHPQPPLPLAPSVSETSERLFSRTAGKSKMALRPGFPDLKSWAGIEDMVSISGNPEVHELYTRTEAGAIVQILEGILRTLLAKAKVAIQVDVAKLVSVAFRLRN